MSDLTFKELQLESVYIETSNSHGENDVEKEMLNYRAEGRKRVGRPGRDGEASYNNKVTAGLNGLRHVVNCLLDIEF